MLVQKGLGFQFFFHNIYICIKFTLVHVEAKSINFVQLNWAQSIYGYWNLNKHWADQLEVWVLLPIISSSSGTTEAAWATSVHVHSSAESYPGIVLSSVAHQVLFETL